MKKIILILAVSLALSATSGAIAGEKSEKVGEIAGKAAKGTKEAGIVVIDATKKGAKKTGKFFKEVYKDMKKGAKKGYESE
ncbi:MAG: hypothetical protein C0603_04095 [Denitrovibrio sp.]|nr:MAG: hypothetical protein C0603_04095 [Denitrovibrio sp.]